MKRFESEIILFIVITFLSMSTFLVDAEDKIVEKTVTSIELPHWYLGAKAGFSHFSSACEVQDVDCESDGLGGGFFFGYQLKNWLFIEGGYDYLGKAKAIYPALGDPTQDVDYESRVQGLELGLKADYYLSDNIVLFAKAGMLGWYNETEGEELFYDVNESENGISPMLGGGVEYHLSKRWVSRLEYQWFDNVGKANTGGADSHLLTLGLRYKFGVKEPVVQEPSAPIVMPKPTEKSTEILSEYNGRVVFQVDSDELSSTIITSLQPILNRLLSYPQAQLSVIGYTDTSGDTQYNQKLSEKRAQSIATYLIEKGVSPNNIKISGMGEVDPVEDNNTIEGRAENRRVEFNSPQLEVTDVKLNQKR